MFGSTIEPNQSYATIVEATQCAERVRAHFQKFQDNVSVYESSTEDLSAAAFKTTPGTDYFEVATPSHCIRFSLTMKSSVDNDGSMFGLVTVHLMPAHELFEAPALVGSFTIDKSGFTNFARHGRPLTVTSWQQSMAIMTHFHATAVNVQPARPASQ